MMREDLKPGTQFPDFSLLNIDGLVVQLSQLMQGWPTVVTFNRGNY